MTRDRKHSVEFDDDSAAAGKHGGRFKAKLLTGGGSYEV